MTVFRCHMANGEKLQIDAGSASAARDAARARRPGVRVDRVKLAKGEVTAPAPAFGRGHLWPLDDEVRSDG